MSNEQEKKGVKRKARIGKSPEPPPAKIKLSDIDFKKCDRKTEDGKEYNFKITTWNVAGIRACTKKGLVDYIKHEDADIFCMQETKCPKDKLPDEVRLPNYYRYYATSDVPGHSGVALYSKEKPLKVTYGMESKNYDKEGRLIIAEYDKFYLITVYVVNAGAGLKNLEKRMDWEAVFKAYIQDLDKKKPVIIAGDMNVAHKPIDLANPSTNTKTPGFTIEERDCFTSLLKDGFVDSFRHLYPELEGAYTFWSYLRNARGKNVGWRLDYFVVSERLMPQICDNVMRSNVFGSDHCPITLFLNL